MRKSALVGLDGCLHGPRGRYVVIYWIIRPNMYSMNLPFDDTKTEELIISVVLKFPKEE